MRLFFSVGEPSGDLHASRLIRELRRGAPELRVSGFGGPLMEAAGCRLHYPLVNLAVMGILAVLPLLWTFFRLLRSAGAALDAERPDAVVLVDYPGFNWWMARLAKRRGIPVIYYLPPQLWAWGGWRIRKLKRLVDQVLCCLPFEADWYRARGVAVRCVGHPFFDEVAERTLDQRFLEEQRAADDAGTVRVGILPGSRNLEIEMNFAVQVELMRRLHARFPAARFLVACYKESQRARCQRILADSRVDLPVELHVGRTAEIIELAHACAMVSGSVSLELLARGTPAVVLYRSGPFHYLLGRLLVTCRYISLPNLIAGRAVMPEFVLLGNDPQALDRMTGHLSEWLADPGAHARAARELTALGREVARPGATAQAARAILETLRDRDAAKPPSARAAA